MKALFVTIPHSGERVPDSCDWLKKLPEEILMSDVDRFVDRLYEPTLKALQIPSIKTEWHRYAADLNRIPEDIDSDSVIGSKNASGSFNRGFHWVVTTYGYKLLSKPMTQEQHDQLVKLVYDPFHQAIKAQYQKYFLAGAKKVYHLDAHSMPSLGTKMHRDPGELRAEIVVSDCNGKSCDKDFCDLVIEAFSRAGFKVAYNWPYFGGRISEQYGDPQKGQQAIQVEMNRGLYMDEVTKKILPDKSQHLQMQIHQALKSIQDGISEI